jgi:Tfp pilus assembly protein PilN
VAAALCCAIVLEWSEIKQSDVRATAAMLLSMNTQLDADRDRSRAIRARQRQLYENWQAFQDVQARESWAPRLARIAGCVPDHVTITQLMIVSTANEQIRPAAALPAKFSTHRPKRSASTSEAARSAPKHQLQIDGMASCHADVTRLLFQLQTSGVFSRVTLVRSVANDASAQSLLHFTILCWS